MAKKRNSTTYKPAPAASYPAGSQNLDEVGAAGFKRVETFLTPTELKNRYLFGVNLKDPYTQQEMTDDTFKSVINQMYAQAELDLNIDIFPIVKVKRIEYDRAKSTEGYGFGQLNLGSKNVNRVLELSIRTINSLTFNEGIPNHDLNDPNNTLEGQVLFEFPLAWLDLGMARKGLIYISPLRTFPSAIIPGALTGGGNTALVQVFDRLRWVPSFFYVKFQCGFENNGIPAPINNYVGLLAKREVMFMVLQAIKSGSQSISHDGTSQSYSNAALQTLPSIIQGLDAQIAAMKNKLKTYFSTSIWMTNW